MTETKISESPMRLVKLTTRDVADAKRLLSLLAGDSAGLSESTSKAAEGTLERNSLRIAADQILSRRKRRYTIFGDGMFGEPAWEILLLVYLSEWGARPTIRGLAELAALTKSTALRWIDYLERQHLIRREPHPTDKRAAFVELTALGKERLELYLSGTVAAGGIPLG